MIKGGHHAINVVTGAILIERAGDHLRSFIGDDDLRFDKVADNLNPNKAVHVPGRIFCDEPGQLTALKIINGLN